MKAWLTYVDLDWKKVYTATLRRKFRWVEDYSTKEIKDFYPTRKEMTGKEMAVVQEES